jgi:signal transduction histidine kinase
MRVGGAGKAGAHRQRIRARNDVVGHSRVRRAGSIGLRLLLPIAVASVGLVAAGVLQVASSVRVAGDASRARVLADATAAVVRLVDQIDQEIAETNALRERGGTAGEQLVSAQRARTDRAMTAYLTASQAAVAERPGLRRAANHVTSLLGPFRQARSAATAPDSKITGFGDAFEQITHHLLEFGAAIAEQLAEPRIGNLARSASNVSELKHLANQQRDLLRTAFTRREMSSADLVTLAELYGDEQARRSQLTHIADAQTRERYAALSTGPDVDTAGALRDAVIRSGGAAASLNVDADEWYIKQSGATRQLRTLELELTAALARTAQRSEANALTRAVVTGGIAALVVLGTLTGGAVLAVRTTRRLRRLRHAALAVARTELPVAVAEVAGAGTPDRLRGALITSNRRVAAMMDPGSDEVSEVSAAIGVVHQQALRLAAEQAVLRQEVSALFVALSRRGQSLVHRQLQLIDEFQHAESDPHTRARLFALDHLAARMRRNEENLLVLAGGEPGRRFEKPLDMTSVTRAAAAEIEAYDRVQAPIGDEVWIAAPAVGDVIHVLAELLDNATAFSPPETRVRVVVKRVPEGVTVSVVDQGIGMSPGQLNEVNRRLARPSVLTSALVGTMGLLVVARLAARRGARVQLRSAGAGGTTAEVLLPETMLTSAPTVPALRAAPPAQAWPAAAVPVPAGAAPVRAVPVNGVPSPVLVVTPAATRAAVVPPPPAPPPRGAPLTPEPATQPAPADAPLPRRTASGLPVRQPGTHAVIAPVVPVNRSPAGPATARTSPTPPSTDPLDPETVRARLASLAGGIAAAARHVEAPPGAATVPGAPAVPGSRPAAD